MYLCKNNTKVYTNKKILKFTHPYRTICNETEYILAQRRIEQQPFGTALLSSHTYTKKNYELPSSAASQSGFQMTI